MMNFNFPSIKPLTVSVEYISLAYYVYPGFYNSVKKKEDKNKLI